MRSKITDFSSGTGVYEGDLAYGRCNGQSYKRGEDFPANRSEGKASNVPALPLKLIEPRDVALWTKDSRIKEAKKSVENSQHYLNHLIEMYRISAQSMRCNIKLRVGKVRLEVGNNHA